MFTTRNLFSLVSCPHQDTCVLPRCIFKHSAQLTPVVESLINTEALDTTTDSLPNIQNVKRNIAEKRSFEPKPPAPPSVASKKRILVTAEQKSTPPVRRKTEAGSVAIVKKTPAPVSPPTSAQPHKNEAKPPVEKCLKLEALNPRALKYKAPASHDMRYRLLRALYDQFSRLNSEVANDKETSNLGLVLSEQALIKRALDIEEESSSSPSVYSNLVKNKILVYKRMSLKQWTEELVQDIARSKTVEKMQSNQVGGSKGIKALQPIETGFSLKEELELLPQLYTLVTDLSKHGYVTACPTDEEIESARKGIEAAKGWEVCDRCKTRFEVFPGRREEDGALTSGGQCTYHFGKPYTPEKSTSNPKAKRDRKYRCCEESLGDSPGCTTAPCHVFKISEVKRLATILNFKTTPSNPTLTSKIPVCLDGEMGYTVHGLELIRLTATSWLDGSELFDVLVRPFGPVLDLNSRYSGVYPEDMANAPPWTSKTPTNSPRLHIVPSPAEARSLLFSFLAPTTPLIGHGLENDLNAIRVIHPTLIDTALLFPHKAGLPYRNSLKVLTKTLLSRQIQGTSQSERAGHDSKEDANAAGDLVKYALKIKGDKLKKSQEAKSTG